MSQKEIIKNIKILFNNFIKDYKAEGIDRKWQEQSDVFRDFWDKKVLNKKVKELKDSDIDKVVRYLDRNAKGNTKEDEAAAIAMISQGMWRRMFKDIHKDNKLHNLLSKIFIEKNEKKQILFIDELYKANEERKNGLTGPNGNAINAMIFVFDPARNISIVSLNHRQKVIEFFGFSGGPDFENDSPGKKIVLSNKAILDGFNDIGINMSSRTISGFLYLEHVRKMWQPEITKGRIKKFKPDQRGSLVKEDSLFEDTKETEEPLKIPIDVRKVLWHAKDLSAKHLYEMWKEGDLNIQPEFQRFKVWDEKKEGRLIESALLEVPIPSIYLAEENDGKYSVIDGQQRLWSFFDFFDGNLVLNGLRVFNELNGKKFIDLSKEIKSSLWNFTPHLIIIKKESNPDIRFEIFERLNTGAVKLNDQELRNCIYRGEYNRFLKELVDNQNFQFLLGLNKPHKRMVDRELILRFFAFLHNTYLRYEPPMKSFLNEEMGTFQDIENKEKEKLVKSFKKSVELTKTVFGEKSFKRFRTGSEDDPNGIWEAKKLNKALFDIIMFGFLDYEKNQIVPRSDALREELIWLMTNDQEFIDSIALATGNKASVLLRFEKWLKGLRKIVGYPKRETRGFSLALKKELYNNNSTCRICEQKIQTLDDSEVDHIEFYWRGGKTIPSNARLVHRYCNRHRGGRD